MNLVETLEITRHSEWTNKLVTRRVYIVGTWVNLGVASGTPVKVVNALGSAWVESLLLTHAEVTSITTIPVEEARTA